MEINKRKNFIKYGLGVFLSFIIIFGIIMATRQINRITNKEKNNLKAEVEQQTSVPEGYIGIYNANDLKNIANNLTANYILMANINMSGIEWTPLGLNNTAAFTGVLDGNSYTISNLNIESTQQYTGMFGYVNAGTIKNLTLENITVSSTYIDNNAYIGTLAGYVDNGTISNISVNGSISYNQEMTRDTDVGGLIGDQTNGTIENSNTNVEMNLATTSGGIYSGGLIGYANTITNITNVYATGNITNTSTSGRICSGGLIGSAYRITNITNVYATGNITNTSTTGEINSGGLIGSANSITNIKNTYSTGKTEVIETTGLSYLGGLVGYTYGRSSSKIYINNSYAIGKIIGGTNQGGLIGYLSSYVYVTNSYWSPETTGQSDSKAGTPKLLQSMLYQNTYTDWDFDTIWKIEEGETLPYLLGIKKPESVNKTNYTYSSYEGNGTEENPFIITTPEQLQGMKNDLNAHYRLANDINMMGVEWNEIGKTTNGLFSGVLDGNSYTISNLNIESTQQYTGMFGYVKGGTIKNLTLENVTVSSRYIDNYAYIGTLVGFVNSGTISNISVDGSINYNQEMTKNTYVGGLIGYQTNGTIENSNTNVEMNLSITSGQMYSGGLIGYADTITNITNVYATGNITTTGGSTGGLIGYADTITNITNVYATGNITTMGGSTGGLIGYANLIKNIKKAYSTGNIISKSSSNNVYAGGLIGYAYCITKITNEYRIENTYSTSNIEIESGYVGGLVGYVKDNNIGSLHIYNSYAVGKITGGTNVGGLIAYSIFAAVTNSYWSPETIGQRDIQDSTTKLLQSMLYQNTYKDWDFDTIWKIEEGETLPYLLDIEKPESVNKTNYTYIPYEGKGTEENPFIITTPEQLQGMKHDLNLHYRLANDINMIGVEWNEIGKAGRGSFTGVLDGNSYTISNLNIESTQQYTGMFGYVNAGTIKNLTLENITVSSTYIDNNAYIGTLAGYVDNGTISNISVNGSISYNQEMTRYTYVGGLIGYQTNGTIENSNANVEMSISTTTGAINSGGLIGYAGYVTNITNVYAKGNITNTSTKGQINSGGLIGYAKSITNITNAYATGNITNTSTTGQIYSGGLIGYANTITNIKKSYSTGNVISKSSSNNVNVGGLIGYAVTSSASSSNYNKHMTIENTYSTSNIEIGSGYAGGLVGCTYGSYYNSSYYNNIYINNSYAIGKITGGTNQGGLIAYINSSSAVVVTNSYWSPETTGVEVSATTGEKSKTIQELLYQDAYENWDFDTIWTIEPNGESLAYLRELVRPNSVLKDELINETRVIVTKIWNDNDNEKGRRPQNIILKLMNGDTEVGRQMVSEAESWKHNFEGLPKYDENGNVINYTIAEEAVNEKDLEFYESNINEETKIITNTYRVPNYDIAEKMYFNIEQQDENGKRVNKANYEMIYLDTTISKSSDSNTLRIQESKKVAGTYEYILRQKEEVKGYSLLEETKIYVTYNDNGDITNVESSNNNVIVAIADDKSNINIKTVLKIQKDEIAKEFSVKMIKTDKETKEQIEGANYDVLVTSTGGWETISNATTGEDGTFTINNMTGSGKIYVIYEQLNVPEGYIGNEEQKQILLTVNENKELILDIENSTPGVICRVEEDTLVIEETLELLPRENQIRIYAQDNNFALEGVKFSVTTPKGEEIVLKTDEEGVATLDDIGMIEAGEYSYFIKQLTSINGYDLISEISEIKVIFDEKGLISNVQTVSGSAIASKIIESEETVNYYIADIKIPQIRNSSYTVFNFELNKKDYDTSENLKGVVYKIKQEVKQGETTTIKTSKVETNNNGQIVLELQSADRTIITLQELKTITGYVLDDTKETIELTKNGDEVIVKTESENVVFENNTLKVNRTNIKKNSNSNSQKTNTSFYITKVGPNGELLKDVDVELRETKTGKRWTLKTDEEGLARIPNEYMENLATNIPEMKIGEEGRFEFWITEGEAPMGFEGLPEDVGFEILYEIDLEGNLKVNTMNVLDGSSYTYIIDQRYSQYDTEKYLQVDVELKLMNRYAQGKKYELEIVKKDSANENILIKNAEYDITIVYPTAGGMKVRKVTDSSGKIYINPLNLPQGVSIIKIQETKAPAGYELNSNIIEIKVKRKDDELSIESGNAKIIDNRIVVELTNVKQKVTNPYGIVIRKIDADYDFIELSGAKFDINITTSQRSYSYKDVIVSDKTYEAILQGLVHTGEITIEIQETKAPVGYILDSTVRTIVINRDSQTGRILLDKSKLKNISGDNVNIKNNNLYVEIKNRLRRISSSEELQIGESVLQPILMIEKVSSKNYNNKLEDAIFEITYPDNTMKILETTSSGYGSISLGELQSGRYKIKEIQVPMGYREIGEILLDIEFDGRIITRANLVDSEGKNSVVEIKYSEGRVYLMIKNQPISISWSPGDEITGGSGGSGGSNEISGPTGGIGGPVGSRKDNNTINI